MVRSLQTLKCQEGESDRHNWYIEDTQIKDGKKIQTVWCRKCGHRTQLTDGKQPGEDVKEPEYLTIPSFLRRGRD